MSWAASPHPEAVRSATLRDMDDPRRLELVKFLKSNVDDYPAVQDNPQRTDHVRGFQQRRLQFRGGTFLNRGGGRTYSDYGVLTGAGRRDPNSQPEVTDGDDRLVKKLFYVMSPWKVDEVGCSQEVGDEVIKLTRYNFSWTFMPARRLIFLEARRLM